MDDGGSMSETSRERVARNQSAYRKVNEGIRAGRDASSDQPRAFVCECAFLGCNQLVELTMAQYESVRRNSQRFVIAEGHDVPDAETVVWASEDGAVVVEKDPDLAPITEGEDPRR
jgi:hypothetical protein